MVRDRGAVAAAITTGAPDFALGRRATAKAKLGMHDDDVVLFRAVLGHNVIAGDTQVDRPAIDLLTGGAEFRSAVDQGRLDEDLLRWLCDPGDFPEQRKNWLLY